MKRTPELSWIRVSSLKPAITDLLFACTLNAVNWSLLKLSHVVDLCQRKLLFKGKLSMSFSGSSRICCWQFAKKTCLFSILFQSRIGFLVKDLWRNERNTQNLPWPIWEDSKSLQYSWGEFWFDLWYPLPVFFCNFMESSIHILSCPWFSPRMTGLRSSVLSFPAFLWLRRSSSKLLSVICSDVMTRTTLLFVHCLTTLKSL